MVNIKTAENSVRLLWNLQLSPIRQRKGHFLCLSNPSLKSKCHREPTPVFVFAMATSLQLAESNKGEWIDEMFGKRMEIFFWWESEQTLNNFIKFPAPVITISQPTRLRYSVRMVLTGVILQHGKLFLALFCTTSRFLVSMRKEVVKKLLKSQRSFAFLKMCFSKQCCWDMFKTAPFCTCCTTVFFNGTRNFFLVCDVQ